MAQRLLLDTDVLIEYLRGRTKAVQYLEALTEELFVSVISVAELYVGLKGDDERQALEQFLLAFRLLPVTDAIARTAGGFRRDYGPSHSTSLADALIAATAQKNADVLVTFNTKHFPMLDNVRRPYRRR